MAAVACAGVFAVPATAAGNTTECTGTLTGSYDKIVVPSGATCDLAGATVNGDVRILSGGSLISHGSTIYGSVRGDGAGTVRLYDTDVIGTGTEGNINLTGTTGRIVIGNEGCQVDPAVGNNHPDRQLRFHRDLPGDRWRDDHPAGQPEANRSVRQHRRQLAHRAKQHGRRHSPAQQ